MIYYNKILNPSNGKMVNIKSKTGKKILNKYILYSLLGGSKVSKQRSKHDKRKNNNPLSGMDPLSQIYEFYDNILNLIDNSEELLKIFAYFNKGGIDQMCNFSKKMSDEICNLENIEISN